MSTMPSVHSVTAETPALVGPDQRHPEVVDVASAHQNGASQLATDRVTLETRDANEEQQPAPLERLPVELRLHILENMPDLETLSSLIHASPVYFAQYRSNRKQLLFRCLQHDLGRELLVEAYAAFKSRPFKIGPRVVIQRDITDFVDLYGAWRCSGDLATMLKSMSLADVRWLAWFHTLTVKPLAAQFSTWALTNLESAAAKATEDQRMQAESASLKETPTCNTWPSGLSVTEQRRILRAFYRFEIFCNLFMGDRDELFAHVEIAHVFFPQFGSWEIEEIDCVYMWIKERYGEVVTEIKLDFHPNSSKFADDPDSESEPEDSFTRVRDYDEYLNGTIGHGGLRLALHMFKIKDHDKLVHLMGKYLKQSQEHFFGDCMEGMSQVERRESYDNGFSDRDRAEERGEPMPFTGDDNVSTFSSHNISLDILTMSESTPHSADTTENASEAAAVVSSINAPPLAWVLMWDGKYCNLYGEYIPDELRRWGYVMWDERRWNSIDGALGLLIRLWASSSQLKMARVEWPWLEGRQPALVNNDWVDFYSCS
ncbi:hypothetical protein KVR01_013643 [Diaporthe batatas]|uniref:uncharacterized protein n=1 Tax=Diaporthe batatas TaxID=748121 RepID=UPI001D0408DD|nr:uncharacterized protein KVR01_013643 [Diaporthe batatas]KAG8156539.1 hypothetical protein KVR01_013643 [Diaporthe batatas]